MRYMEEEWDALVDSVETGVLPDWEGTSHVRQYLEVKLEPLQRHTHLLVDLQAKILGETELPTFAPSENQRNNLGGSKGYGLGSTWSSVLRAVYFPSSFQRCAHLWLLPLNSQPSW